MLVLRRESVPGVARLGLARGPGVHGRRGTGSGLQL